MPEQVSEQFKCIFVYGSLMSGMERSWAIPAHIERRRGAIFGKLYFADYAFVLLTDNTDFKVWGEILFVPEKDYDEVITYLDRVEGVSSKLYSRVTTRATLTEAPVSINAEMGDDVECEVYVRDSKQLDKLKTVLGRDRVIRIYDGWFKGWLQNPEGMMNVNRRNNENNQ